MLPKLPDQKRTDGELAVMEANMKRLSQGDTMTTDRYTTEQDNEIECRQQQAEAQDECRRHERTVFLIGSTDKIIVEPCVDVDDLFSWSIMIDGGEHDNGYAGSPDEAESEARGRYRDRFNNDE